MCLYASDSEVLLCAAALGDASCPGMCSASLLIVLTHLPTVSVCWYVCDREPVALSRLLYRYDFDVHRAFISCSTHETVQTGQLTCVQ